MSREALVLLVCCCDFRDGAEWLIPSKSLRNAVIRAFPGLFCILRMCAPRRAAAVVRPRGREKSADRRRRILISRLLIIRASVPRRKSPFPAYFKGFPAVSPLIPPYPAFLKYPVSPQLQKAVGERVYHSRKLARMSKEELAERLGISSQYVNDIEQGKKCMSMAIFVELGEVFHTGLDELAHGAQKEEPVLEHLLCHLRQLSPVQRDMAVHMLHLAFRAAQELGPEE